jgi:hypothetical protein
MKLTDGTPDTVTMVTGPMQSVVSDQHASVVGVPLIVAKRFGNRIPVDVTRVKIFTGRFPDPSAKIFDATRPKIAPC